MIEGVLPHVRDDDWCGEFRAAAARRVEQRPNEAFAPGPLLPIAGGSFSTRTASVSSLQSTTPLPKVSSILSSGTRADD